MNGLTVPSPWFTGKSLSEALIFESTNPQYDNRLFIELQVQYMKIQSSNQRYTHRVLQTIQMKLILLWVWAERAVLGRAKTALKFKYEI